MLKFVDRRIVGLNSESFLTLELSKDLASSSRARVFHMTMNRTTKSFKCQVRYADKTSILC